MTVSALAKYHAISGDMLFHNWVRQVEQSDLNQEFAISFGFYSFHMDHLSIEDKERYSPGPLLALYLRTFEISQRYIRRVIVTPSLWLTSKQIHRRDDEGLGEKTDASIRHVLKYSKSEAGPLFFFFLDDLSPPTILSESHVSLNPLEINSNEFLSKSVVVGSEIESRFENFTDFELRMILRNRSALARTLFFADAKLLSVAEVRARLGRALQYFPFFDAAYAQSIQNSEK